jgi:signal transduction histidine kinase
LDSLELVTAATSNLALLPYVVSLACAIAVTLFALARSEVRSARTYAVVTAGQAAWITGFLFKLTRTTLAGKVAWDHVEFAAMCLCAVALLNFAAGETGRRVPRSWLAVLGVPCLAGLLYLVLNPVARASARIAPGRLPALLYDFTWVDLAAFAYTMVLVLVANGLFLRQVLIRRGVYRTQALLLFLGGMLPLLSAVFLAVGVTVLGQRDTTPFTFAASNLITSWALFRHRLFELLPVARDAVFESLQDSVLVFDREGQLVDLNAAAASLFQLSTADLGKPVRSDFEGWEALRIGEDATPRGQLLVRRAAGGEEYFDTRLNPLRTHGEEEPAGSLVVLRNVTVQRMAELSMRRAHDELEERVAERTDWLRAAQEEKLRLQEHLHQSQKMDTVGRLAGGVAHDFNNLLTVILGNVQLLKNRLGADAPLSAQVLEVERAASSAASLTGRLLAFSRKQPVRPSLVDLDGLVSNLHRMLERLLEEDIRLDTPTTGKPLLALVDRTQVEQALMNLVVNARDAMPRGGRLTISVSEAEVSPGEAERGGEIVPGRYVRLSVIDTGTGMSPEVRKRAFEPFFSTKETGKGTGLGLSIVYAVMEQNGGFVDLDTEEGRGTAVHLFFPRTGKTAMVAAPVRLRNSPQGTETILVVEDQEYVRRLAVRCLRELGYSVLAAGSAEEALDVAAAHEGPIHLLVTDVIMPGMNGRALAHNFLMHRPAAKVLYISGYTDDVFVQRGLSNAALELLNKPFTPEVLGQRVRDLLDRTQPASFMG